MIEINQLRLGNKVKVTIGNDAGIYEVLGVPAWGMDGCGNGTEPLVMIDRCPKQLVPCSKLRGIKITEAILKECGFEFKDMFDLGICIDKPIYHLNFGLSFFRGSIYIGEGDCKIKYLHQLQNLYFSLTGQEIIDQLSFAG